MNPLVTIIILNWNGWQDTLECLESLYQIDYDNYRVILVDNHSQDQSLEKIREYCQGKIIVQSKFFTYENDNKPIIITELTNKQLESNSEKKDDHNPQSSKQKLILIENDQNYGFAKGNNIAIEYSLKNFNPDYILLLNNDTIVDPEFLKEMVNTAEINDKNGILGAKLLNAYNKQIIDSTGHVLSWGRMVDRGHDEFDRGQYDEKTEIMGAMAAAALYKKDMLLEIGILDTSYVTLGEDADLSWRAYNNGWKAVYAPKAIVYHKRGRTITKKSVIPKMTILSTENTVKYVIRYGNSYNKFLFMFVLFKEGLSVLVGSIIGRNEINTGEYFRVLMRSYLKIFKSF